MNYESKNNQNAEDLDQAAKFAAAAAEDGDVVNEAQAIADVNLGQDSKAKSVTLNDSDEEQAELFAAAAAEDGDVVNENEAKADVNLGK